MADEKKYINRNNPVYISYAWANKENPTIEKDVDALCKKLDESGIFFKRDKEENPEKQLIPYRWSIVDAAKEIGEGTVVLVFISEKFLESLDCLRELYEIQKNGHTTERVFYILLKGGGIRDREIYKEIIVKLNKKREEIVNDIKNGGIYLSNAEMFAVGNDMFLANVGRLYQDTSNYNSGNIKKFRKEAFETVISQVREILIKEQQSFNYSINDNEDSWKSFAECVKKYNDSILLIGDYILQIEKKPLGLFFDDEVLKIAKSRLDPNATSLDDWYKRNYNATKIIDQIKNDGYDTIIKADKNNVIDCKKLIELLKTNRFSTIVSIGYSKHIREVMIAYAKEKLQYWELNSDSASFRKKEIKKTEYAEENNIHVKDFENNSIPSETIKFYDLVRTTNRKSLVFSELDIVEFLHSCVVAMKDGSISDGNKISGSNFLALGTKFPNWSLRFIWCVFNKIIRDSDTLSPRSGLLNILPLKEKTTRFLINNGVLLVESKNTFRFIETIQHIL